MAAEFATLQWVDWFRFNNRRDLDPIGNRPPAEESSFGDSHASAPLIASTPVRRPAATSWGSPSLVAQR